VEIDCVNENEEWKWGLTDVQKKNGRKYQIAWNRSMKR
jgi:hypothetical protein